MELHEVKRTALRGAAAKAQQLDVALKRQIFETVQQLDIVQAQLSDQLSYLDLSQGGMRTRAYTI